MKKKISLILAGILACTAMTTSAFATDVTETDNFDIFSTSDYIEIVYEDAQNRLSDSISPFASDHISAIVYAVNTGAYGASITMRGTYSGSVSLELLKKSGSSWTSYDTSSMSFTSKTIWNAVKVKSVTSGTYKVKAVITVNGSTYTRESSEYTI